jgi:type I restriction enzyme M protein
MLDTDTKRRIDSCRDILVGKVPDPKSQVEQITIALIYKFMDDMDAEAEELGGKRSFFAGDYGKYGWARLMAPTLGGFDVLALYSEAIGRMNENPGIPALFRDIFKNAYLPYRDPETLRAFLKEIDGFTYDHSERLGDAFEYLLSVLGSQGDAGQFRTPRHIIDFMVDVINPQKNESLLDPACGTAGFLISAWKHILKQNTKDRAGDQLTPTERANLAANIHGYDISPDMVRLSLVNLYLHGFSDPHIVEYDTLTSEERWNETADVILANPPFMSPKGGIKPHKRFSIQAKRSEVLFVDYMAEHLSPTGRAAIIVPEGIIFQSQTAYKQLREMLVKTSLVAVVSLPAGCFNPYSGVKTSILILDKAVARKCDTIAFFKVENDGFGLGAQRRAIDRNDLPRVNAELADYLQALRNQQATDYLQPTFGLIVAKERIAANGDYNLSGERYREGAASNHSFPLVSLGDESLFRVESGGTPKSDVEEYWGGGIPWATLVDLPSTDFISEITVTKRTISDKGLRVSSAKMIPANSVVVSTRATIGRIAINRVPIATNQGFKNVVIEDSERVVPAYVALALTKLVPTMQAWATGGTFAEISKSKFCELQIPLPPLEVQKEIVAEIEGYQKVINGARAVLDHYRPHMPIHPDWPMMELGKVCEAIVTGPFGSALHQSDYVDAGIPVINPQNIVDGTISTDGVKMVSPATRDRLKEFTVREDDIVIGRRGEMGRCGVVTSGMNGWLCGTGSFVIRLKDECLARFAFFQIASPKVKQYLEEQAIGVTMKNLNQGILSTIQIPLPPLATQQAIVAEIEAEQALVAANRELIARFEKKIQATLARIWGEEEAAVPARGNSVPTT